MQITIIIYLDSAAETFCDDDGGGGDGVSSYF